MNTDRKDDAVTLHKVRVTQEPGVVREVDDSELNALARQGLVHSYEHTDEAAAVLPDGFKAPQKWKAPAKGGETVTASPDLATPAASTDTEGGAK